MLAAFEKRDGKVCDEADSDRDGSLAAGRRSRFHSMALPGIVVQSDFSGQLSPEASLVLTSEAASRLHVGCDAASITCFSTSDSGVLQQRLATHKDAEISHVFPDVCHVYSPELMEKLDAI